MYVSHHMLAAGEALRLFVRSSEFVRLSKHKAISNSAFFFTDQPSYTSSFGSLSITLKLLFPTHAHPPTPPPPSLFFSCCEVFAGLISWAVPTASRRAYQITSELASRKGTASVSS